MARREKGQTRDTAKRARRESWREDKGSHRRYRAQIPQQRRDDRAKEEEQIPEKNDEGGTGVGAV